MKSIESLPQPVQNMFNVVKQSASHLGEDRANQVAWETVKQKFTKVDNIFTAKSSDFDMYETVHFEFKADEMSVTKTDDGFTTIDYVLSGNNTDLEGKAFSDFALKTMTAQINEEGLTGRLEDEDHDEYKALILAGKTPAEIEEIIRSKKGIKTLNARYENGKMIARLQVPTNDLDKVLSYKGASIEARVPKEAYRAGVYNQARAVGFVFTNKPANPITGLVS